MKFTIEQSNGYGRTKISTFNDGKVSSMQGAFALKSAQLKDEASILRYAKENNLTISFGRRK